MCGIAGAIFWDSQLAAPFRLESAVRAMTHALAHRGPDGEGIVSCPPRTGGRSAAAALGHRRLAIIDLSERAAQPMSSPRLPVTLTFNGEIYNFSQLRRDLESCGRQFRSDSDTEVILQGYEEWGSRVVDRLRGMFALAIWDARTQALLLARDRLGIKPLYVYREARGILFASEVRALLASGLVPRTLDRVAVDQYLTYQTVASPRTLVAGVQMTAPATVVTVSAERFHEREYWHLLGSAEAPPSGESPDAMRARLSAVLDEAAALHMVSDVPVGVFLSSGVDSSAVGSLVRRTGVVPRTFCVSFPGTAFDEGPRAREIAAAIGSEHTDIPTTEQELRAQLPEAVAAVDHPSGDGINTFVVSHAVRAAGLKVALSGLGGDELFGGYPSFRRLRRIQGYARVWRWSPAPLRRAAATAVRAFGGSSVSTAKTAALLETDGGLASTYPIMRQVFSRQRRVDRIGRGLVDESARAGDPYVDMLMQTAERFPDANVTTIVSFAEARTYMHDVLLRDTDQMSMRHGLEVRVPLLDHRLAACVMGLPEHAKTAGRPKQLLVDAIGGEVLPAIAARPKQGFVLPFEVWMRGDLRDFCEAHLGRTGLGGGPLFDGPAIESVWQGFLDGRGESWSRPWALVALHAWMDATGVRP